MLALRLREAAHANDRANHVPTEAPNRAGASSGHLVAGPRTRAFRPCPAASRSATQNELGAQLGSAWTCDDQVDAACLIPPRRRERRFTGRGDQNARRIYPELDESSAKRSPRGRTRAQDCTSWTRSDRLFQPE